MPDLHVSNLGHMFEGKRILLEKPEAGTHNNQLYVVYVTNTAYA
jgi:hypothetical protein